MNYCKYLLISSLSLLLTSIPLNSQILNASFESWNAVGEPDNWITGWVPGTENLITQSSDSQDGNLSARMEVMDLLGNPYSGNLQSLDSINFFGHPISQKYGSLSIYQKFNSIGGAQLLTVVSLYSAEYGLIGVGGITLEESVENWTQFTIPFDYFGESDPAFIIVSINITDTTSEGMSPETIGSVAYIDNITLEDPSAVDFVRFDDIKLSQNYPNPFNPSTKIEYTIPREVRSQGSEVRLVVYDVLGREITALVNRRQKPGTYEVVFNTSSLDKKITSGIYFYKLTIGNYTDTKKMMLIQ